MYSHYLSNIKIAWDFKIETLLTLDLHYSRSYYTSTSTFTFPFIALSNLSYFVLLNHLCMGFPVTFNKMFSLTSQKGDSIAGGDYLKVKNDVIHCKTIISNRSPIHATPNFSVLSSMISSYVTITCYTLLHQATRGEWKNSFRRCRNIFFSDRDPQHFSVLHYDVLSSFKLYNIQFKKFKILWGPGAKSQGPRAK